MSWLRGLALGLALGCVGAYAADGDGSASDAASRAATQVDAANQRFWEGAPAEAAAGYRAALAAHPRSADLWFNLGTAEAEAQRLGAAIHALEQSLLLNPTDPDAAHNLSVARQRVLARAVSRGSDGRVVLPGEDDLGTGLVTAVPPRILAWSFALPWIALFALVGLWLRTRRPALRTASSFGAVLCALVALGAGGLLVGRAQLDGSARFGVVLPDEASVRLGPGERYARTALVLGGVKVRLQGEDGGWRQVALPDGSDGWLPAAEVAPLRLAHP